MVAKVETKEAGLAAVLITMIITRIAPSLEVGLFAYLLSVETVRKALGVAKDFGWSYMSTAAMQKMGRSPEAIEALYQAGVIHFDCGMGAFDQHGAEENREFSRICSLDLVRDQVYDFLARRPWLKDVFQLVRQNDLDGKQITKAEDSLRLLVSGLVSAGASDQDQIDFMVVGFAGIVRQVKDGVPATEAFGLKEMAKGVEKALPKKLSWFCDLAEQAKAQNDLDEKEAKQLVQRAIDAKQTATVRVPGLSRPVRVIWLEGRSPKVGPISRWKKFDLCVVKRPDGHVQIFGGTIYVDDPEKGVKQHWRIDLAQIARVWRIKEAAAAGQRLQDGDWLNTGFVYYLNGQACPVYLSEFRTLLANGTQSSPDVTPTLLPVQEIFRLSCLNLNKCGLLCEVDGEYQPVSVAA